LEGSHEASWEDVSLALEINPNSFYANATKGMLLVFSGHPKESRDVLLTALRLNPHDPAYAFVLLHIAISFYFERDYLKAEEAARRAISRFPEVPLPYRWLAASLGQLGRINETHEALQQAIGISESTFNFYVRSRPPCFRPEDHEHMLEGLRKAGWRD
jgi:adenylate cyclase